MFRAITLLRKLCNHPDLLSATRDEGWRLALATDEAFAPSLSPDRRKVPEMLRAVILI